mmetsp:Transcript_19945/g.55438  ORF Transcript_19945/g.55438 Transcript_19945/m.55438 type:complete len:193 (-) Transcript_19945:367-945(-)
MTVRGFTYAGYSAALQPHGSLRPLGRRPVACVGPACRVLSPLIGRDSAEAFLPCQTTASAAPFLASGKASAQASGVAENIRQEPVFAVSQCRCPQESTRRWVVYRYSLSGMSVGSSSPMPSQQHKPQEKGVHPTPSTSAEGMDCGTLVRSLAGRPGSTAGRIDLSHMVSSCLRSLPTGQSLHSGWGYMRPCL